MPPEEMNGNRQDRQDRQDIGLGPTLAADRRTLRRYRLTEAQRQFFQRQRQSLINIDMGMRGALQMLAEENLLVGKVTLSEDCTELIEEE